MNEAAHVKLTCCRRTASCPALCPRARCRRCFLAAAVKPSVRPETCGRRRSRRSQTGRKRPPWSLALTSRLSVNTHSSVDAVAAPPCLFPYLASTTVAKEGLCRTEAAGGGCSASYGDMWYCSLTQWAAQTDGEMEQGHSTVYILYNIVFFKKNITFFKYIFITLYIL